MASCYTACANEIVMITSNYLICLWLCSSCQFGFIHPFGYFTFQTIIGCWGTRCQNSAFKNHPNEILRDEKHLYGIALGHIIKTHGSVSCSPRSRRITPMSILTGRKKMQFSHLRSSVLPWWNKTIFAVDTPSSFSTPHSKLERNRFKRSQDMWLQKLA